MPSQPATIQRRQMSSSVPVCIYCCGFDYKRNKKGDTHELLISDLLYKQIAFKHNGFKIRFYWLDFTYFVSGTRIIYLRHPKKLRNWFPKVVFLWWKHWLGTHMIEKNRTECNTIDFLILSRIKRLSLTLRHLSFWPLGQASQTACSAISCDCA